MGELIRHDSEGWERLQALVLDSVPSPHSKRAYRCGLDAFLLWYRAGFRPPISKAVVCAYKAQLEALGLSASTINVRLSAIRKLVAEAADNGLISAELAASVAKVKGAPRHGVRMGNWLDREQAERLLQAPDSSTMAGKRDRGLLAVLIGCGLRRSEAAALTFEHIQEREGRWVIVDLMGKHGRVRSIPMPGWAKVGGVWQQGRRMVAWAPLPKTGVPAWQAASLDGGPPLLIPGSFYFGSTQAGRLISIGFTPTRTYVIPADTLTRLPAGRAATEDEVARLSGVRRIEAASAVSGPTPDVYAFDKGTVQRNLYRIPIP
jgi:hypothetical protein